MSLANSTRRAGLLAAAAAAVAAVAAPSAVGAQVGVGGGATSLHLDGGTAAVLSGAGVAVAPVGPADASGTRVDFPITGGRIDPETAAGRVGHSGGLAFSAGGTSVRLTDFVVRTDVADPYLTARVGGARVPLLDLDLSDAVVIRRGPGGIGTWAVRVGATLRPEAAAALNGAFGAGIPAGVRIGRVDLKARPSQVVLDGGATTLALDPGTAAALTGLGVTPSAIPPATAGAAGIAFPITGGRLRAGTFAGSIPHSGGIALTAGATRVELRNLRIDAAASVVTARVGDTRTRVPLALGLGRAKVGVSRRIAVVRGARVSLTDDAAAALNQAFSVSALRGGLVLGTADVRGEVL